MRWFRREAFTCSLRLQQLVLELEGAVVVALAFAVAVWGDGMGIVMVMLGELVS